MKHHLLLPFLFLSVSCSLLQNHTAGEKPLTFEDYQLETANLIAQPNYSGDSMLYKITGADASLEMFYVDTRELYFTCPKNELEDVLDKLLINKDSVTLGKQNGTVVELDTKVYNNTSRAFFKCSVSNLKIDTSKFIETRYNNVTYRITIPQIVDFITMKSNLRGGAFAITRDKKMMISHGVAVSKKGEPSLKGLVSQINDNKQSVEYNAQKLLDFVANEIEYNMREATRGGETIKRPDEILFTRNSDCSGKTILYASLLQQIKVKWCILYYDRHVCVGVAGNFHPQHPSKIELDGVTYYIAETTTPGAVIGENAWGNEMKATDLQYYQVPEEGDDIFDYVTKKPLAFMTKTVSEN